MLLILYYYQYDLQLNKHLIKIHSFVRLRKSAREEMGSTFFRDEGSDLNEVAYEELCFVLESSRIMK